MSPRNPNDSSQPFDYREFVDNATRESGEELYADFIDLDDWRGLEESRVE